MMTVKLQIIVGICLFLALTVIVYMIKKVCAVLAACPCICTGAGSVPSAFDKAVYGTWCLGACQYDLFPGILFFASDHFYAYGHAVTYGGKSQKTCTGCCHE